jgi:hypothetical protein
MTAQTGTAAKNSVSAVAAALRVLVPIALAVIESPSRLAFAIGVTVQGFLKSLHHSVDEKP